MRAGVGAGPPRSRGGVAKRLRISERRVARLERTGLRRLRSLDRAGACAPPAAETAVAVAADVAPASGSTALTAATTGGDRPAGGAGRDGTREKPRSKAGSGGGSVEIPPLGGVAGQSATNLPDGGLDLSIPLLLLGLALIAVVVARTLRSESSAAPMAPMTSAPVEEPARWVPWFRSPMRGPGWNDPRPPSDRSSEWSDTPPEPAAPEHEEWTPPTRRTPSRRR
jgi:hypothetical protein